MKSDAQYGHYAFTNQAVTDVFSCMMMDTCSIPHSDCNQAKILMFECWKQITLQVTALIVQSTEMYMLCPALTKPSTDPAQAVA